MNLYRPRETTELVNMDRPKHRRAMLKKKAPKHRIYRSILQASHTKNWMIDYPIVFHKVLTT